MRQSQLQTYREHVVGGARGGVLQIGFSSSLKPYYNGPAEEIIAVDSAGHARAAPSW